MHLLRSNCGRFLPSTSTISIAFAGQSRQQTVQLVLTSELTSKPKPSAPSVPLRSIMLHVLIVCSGLPRKPSGRVGFTNGYFVVAGLVKMCETVRFHIGDIRDFRGFFVAIIYTNGYTHVNNAIVSINDSIAAGKIIRQLADST